MGIRAVEQHTEARTLGGQGCPPGQMTIVSSTYLAGTQQIVIERMQQEKCFKT